MRDLSTSALVWALTEPATPACREAVVAELVARIRTDIPVPSALVVDLRDEPETTPHAIR